MKETGAPVLYSEYEPCLEAMERERRKGVEMEEEEGEKSNERKGEECIGSVFGTRDGRGRRREWRSRAVMIPASVRENRGRHFLRVLFGTLYASSVLTVKLIHRFSVSCSVSKVSSLIHSMDPGLVRLEE